MARLSGQVSEENKEIMERGRVLMALLVQPENDVLDYETGALLLSLFKQNYLNFFKEVEEVTYIKRLLNQYLLTDFTGKQIRHIIKNRSVGEEKYEIIIREIILPMIKHYLMSKYPYLRRVERFIELYKNVRDDGRVYKNFNRSLEEVSNG